MKSPAQTRAECEARQARVDAMFDGVEAMMRRIHERMKADGLLRDPRSRTRAGDPPAERTGVAA